MKNQYYRNKLRRVTARSFDTSLVLFPVYFGIYIVLYKVSPSILAALTFGWYLSMIIEFVAGHLSRIKFIGYRFSAVISSLFLLLLMGVGIVSIFPILIEEGKDFFPALLKSVGSLEIENIIKNPTIIKYADSLLGDLSTDLVTRLSDIGVASLNFVVHNIPGAFTFLTIFVITALYFTLLLPMLKRHIAMFFYRKDLPKAMRFMREYYNDLRHFIGGQVIIALCVGLLMGTGMAVTGIPYAIFLGFLAGITNFIPYLGVIIAGLPAVFLGLTSGGLMGLIKVLIVILVTNQIESWVLSPNIQGSRMKLNWFAILVAMFICASFFGLVGVLLAIPLLVFFRDFWTEYVYAKFQR